MKRKLRVPKERNPFVAHLATKRSGAHGKTKKAERRAAKVALQRDGPVAEWFSKRLLIA